MWNTNVLKVRTIERCAHRCMISPRFFYPHLIYPLWVTNLISFSFVLFVCLFAQMFRNINILPFLNKRQHTLGTLLYFAFLKLTICPVSHPMSIRRELRASSSAYRCIPCHWIDVPWLIESFYFHLIFLLLEVLLFFFTFRSPQISPSNYETLFYSSEANCFRQENFFF